MSPTVHRILYGPSWDQIAELRRSRRVWCLVAFAAGVLAGLRCIWLGRRYNQHRTMYAGRTFDAPKETP